MTASWQRLGWGGALVTALFALSCDGDERASGLQEDDLKEQAAHADKGDVEIKACVEGKTQECSVTLSEHNGIVSCYYGVQTCHEGKWGECGGGEVVTMEATGDPVTGLALQALSSHSECANNPCDPNCRSFYEEPEASYEANKVEGEYHWDEGVGGVQDYPGGLAKKGVVEPCEASQDCQFNLTCVAPSRGTCSHSVCVEGEALEPGCSKCADRVCEDNPQCCTGPVEGPDEPGDDDGEECTPDETLPDDFDSCEHDPCKMGAGLERECNWCVDTICKLLPHCCDTTGNNSNWTRECSEAVRTVCGGVCLCEEDEIGLVDSCYTYHDKDKSWVNAKAECEKRPGWHLVTINNSIENTMISQLEPSKEKYIGLHEESSQWTWVEDPDIGYWDEWWRWGNIYTNWGSNEPDAYADPDCAYMNNNSTKWYGETACSSNANGDKREYVCEGPPSVGLVPAVLDVVDLGWVWGWLWGWGGGDVPGGDDGSSSECGGDGDDSDEEPEYDGPREWSAECAELVEASCGVKCDEDDPSLETAECTPNYPGTIEASCPGVELSMGIPCEASIPVCNSGQTTALPPIEVVHFPANSPHMPSLSPDLSHPEAATCLVLEPIPPGECVSISDASCVDNKGHLQPLKGNREIMINPGQEPILTAGGEVIECDPYDNWTLYSHGKFECGPPVCTGGSTQALDVVKPVDVIVIVDNSPSMDDEIEEIQARIHEDLADILEESGLDYRVILISRFGDLNRPVGTSDTPVCIGPPLGGNACTDPDNEVPIPGDRFFHFSTDIESWDSWCQVLEGFDKPDEIGVLDVSASGHPSARSWDPIAPGGWGSLLREDAFKTFLIITDDDIDCDDYGYDFDDSPECEGFPHDCHDRGTQKVFHSGVAAGEAAALEFDRTLLEMSPEQFGTIHDRNYVWHSIINITGHPDGDEVAWQPDSPIQRKLCTPSGTSIVGGGTGYQGLSRLTGGLRYPICEKDNFDAIFNVIAREVVDSSAAECEFELPRSASVDYGSAYAEYTTGDDDRIALTRFAGPQSCASSASGWYYDNPQDPERLILCPNTCNAVESDPGARVWYRLPCPDGTPEETSYRERYQATCGVGKLPQWTFFGFDATVPSDGSIEFFVRTAKDEAGLPEAPWVPVGTATNARQACPIAPSPDAECPIDLYQILGPDAAETWALEVEFAITPSTDHLTPQVHNWTVNFSCPDGE